MSIRQRTFLIISITVLALTALLYLTAHSIILRSFEQLEQQHLQRNVGRVDKALRDMLDTLAVFNSDWATWDDTYQFIADHNQDFIDTNLLDETLITARLNVMVFLDLAGQVVYAKGMDLETEQPALLPGGLYDYFTAEHLLDLPDADSGITGIISLPEGYLMLSSQPITTSDASAPVRGALVMGRFMTDEILDRLADITSLQVTLENFDEGRSLPAEVLATVIAAQDQASVGAVHVVNQETVAGYCVIDSLDGTPSLVLRVEEARDIYNEGRDSLRLFLFAIFGVGLASIVLTMLLLERTVLKRLHQLSEAVSGVGESEDLHIALPDNRSDELNSFANNIQNMLLAMRDYQGQLRQANEHLEEEVATRTQELAASIDRLEEEISAREEAQTLLAAARDEALETAALKSQILANISHDARTPLSVIILRTEMLKRGQFGPLTPRQDQTLDGVLANAYELLGFINNLLQGSKLDSGAQQKPNCTTINPAVWLAEFVETVRPIASDKGLQLDLDVAYDLIDTVETDTDWLKHIVTNLVSNAIKFTDEGRVLIRMSNAEPGHWVVAVEDTGSGIPAEAQEQIFEAFWQADSSFTRRTSRGIGLGLSIVKQMVTLLGGYVSVESTLGQGSTFTVTLPVTISQATPALPQT